MTVLVAQRRAREEHGALEVEQEVLEVAPLEAPIELGAVVVAGGSAVEVDAVDLVGAGGLALGARDGIERPRRAPTRT